MEYTQNNSVDACTITMSGGFGFADSAEVRKIIGGLGEHKGKSLTVDFSALQSIDSAGLGMIILMSDAAKENDINLRIKGAQGQVRKMLDISNFSELMTLE